MSRHPQVDGSSRFVDAAVVARELGVTAETVRHWIRIGKIAAVQTPTGRYRISASTLAALVLEKIKTQDAQDAQT